MLSVPAARADDTAPIVALASSFRAVWPELMAAYTEETQAPSPRSSFGSSGLLTTQILRGAPFDVFISADNPTIVRLQAAGKTSGDTVKLANGTLALVSLSVTHPSFNTIKQWLDKERRFKIAIANPRHAPYGSAAKEALQNSGLWPLPRGTVLNAENASQALQFALNGAADIALVPLTLVAQIESKLRTNPVDTRLHSAVSHQLVPLKNSGDGTKKLIAWLRTPKAKAIFQQYALTSP